MSEPAEERHSDEEYLDAVRTLEPAGTTDIADAVGVVRQSADYRLRKLEDEGAVTSTKIGNSLAWRLADETATARPINPDDAFWEAESYEGEWMSASDSAEVSPTLNDVDVDGMRAVLERAGVAYAVVFGSRIRGDTDPQSDVDIAIRFPDRLTAKERFDRRNRIDATLQSHASGFVDVSDVESLPPAVAVRALEEGSLVVGQHELMESDRRDIKQRYESERTRRQQADRAFIDRLADGEI